MPVFISYSHQDKEFAEKLAVHLVRRKSAVWIDAWELKVGDSILDKIQTAIKTASALLVVLSKSSVASEWCRRELSAGLMTELDERRVFVLPLLIEDCDIPIFLREKKYADFRHNYDEGLRETLTAIAGVTSDTQGRLVRPEYHTDWGASWGLLPDGRFGFQFTFVDHSERLQYCAITEINIVCNEALTRHVVAREAEGEGWLIRLVVVLGLKRAAQREGIAEFVLKDSHPQIKTLGFVDERAGFVFEAQISCRRLGVDTDLVTSVYIGQHIADLVDDLSKDAPVPVQKKILEAIANGTWPE